MMNRKPRSPDQPSWREYQKSLKPLRQPGKQWRSKKIRLKKGYWVWAGLLAALSIVIWMFTAIGKNEGTDVSAGESLPLATVHPKKFIEKTDIPIFIGDFSMVNLTENPIQVDFDGHAYQLHTSLDVKIQQYILKRMDRVNSRYIGIVAMNPDTGRLLTMAGYNKINPDLDPCLMANYPAASLFKIISAAAAVEEKGYTPGTRLTFNGSKHTLYKRQLTDKKNRYTSSISFKNAFAQSVNPVFGKIGSLYLEKQTLETYGAAFGFNQNMAFELPLAISRLAMKEDPYHRAEIASGFNRQTTISPLHGAVIVSAVVNQGVPVEPTVIDRVENSAGTPIYQTEPRFLSSAVSQQTADVLERLMVATVTSGTGKKAFRGYSRNKVLSRLQLGGKTGSIYNRAHDARFDWFVGFANEKKGNEKLVVSVMVAHEEYIGTRAGQYARMIIERHFKNYFANKKETSGKNSNG